nr:RNA-directed DNA polymerase, eukaryota [Tanacetum cinerariifolium]
GQFTWCHKSATKMSKLDIFLISIGLRWKVLVNSWKTSGGKARNMLSAKNVKAKYKDELEFLAAISDKGDGNVEVVNKRMEVVNTLQKIDKICSSKMAQKAKVELESDVSNEEMKRAVWDCGIDKSPGPNASGLRINMSKSKIMGVFVDSDKFDELSALVHDVTLTPMSDRWIWTLKSLGDFSVASVRKRMGGFRVRLNGGGGGVGTVGGGGGCGAESGVEKEVVVGGLWWCFFCLYTPVTFPGDMSPEK